MKKYLLATTLLAATTGFAAAEVTLSGDARMGVISDFGSTDVAFTSRARVKFTLSGSTDGGLEFGASFRADNAAASTAVSIDPGVDGLLGTEDDIVSTSRGGGAVNGDAGSVFISGAFGKLSMGDVDDAANSAVGHVSGVGLTGLSDLNESTFIANGDGASDPSALYEYSTGDLTVYASVTNPGDAADALGYSVAAKYALGDYTVALAYEAVDFDGSSDMISHIIIGGSATFGAVTVKANYGVADLSDLGLGLASDAEQYAISVDYKADALTVTAFYNNKEDLGAQEAYGLGASYDLGGGASVVGGYVRNETSNEDAYDLGVSMSF